MNKHAAPEFAMSFTQEAVLLEHRQGSDWKLLGEVPFAGGNVAAKLKDLRGEQADGFSPDTVLVIPDDQILYTRLTISPGSDTEASIARALEGMTPYKGNELAFDWCPDEDGKIDSLRVAAVARKTLSEAEEFARAQGFRPSGYEARPEDDRFDGEPDFGPSQLAHDQRDSLPFSKPNLHQAAITSDKIEIAETEEKQTIISRITAHYVPVVEGSDKNIIPVVAAEEEMLSTEEGVLVTDLPIEDEGFVEKEPSSAGHAIPVAPAVIRHSTRDAPKAGDKLSPRARAVHERAAAARASKIEEDEEDVVAATLLERLQNFSPSTFQVMMGLLVAALLIGFMFLGGEPDAPQATAPSNTDAIPSDVSTSESQPQTATDPVPVEEATAPDAQTPRTQAAPETTGTPVQSDTETTGITPDSDIPQDALTAALAEAMQGTSEAPATDGAAQPDPTATPSEAASIAAGLPVQRAISPASRPDSTSTTEAPATAAPPQQPQPSATQLSSSSRPPRSAPRPAAAPATSDVSPSVPANPLPYEQRSEPEPPRVTGQRPPSRPAARSTPTSEPAATQTAPAPEQNATPSAPSSSRPAARPSDLSLLEEGSTSEDAEPTKLTRAERETLEALMRNLRTAQAGTTGMSEAEHGAVIVLAQARPQRRPVAVAAPSEQAVTDALNEALTSSERPTARATAESSTQDSGGGGSGRPPTADASSSNVASLNQSSRPVSRPSSISSSSGSGSPSLAKDAIEDAIASAVENSNSAPGAVALTALTSSEIPPRRSGNAPTAPTADDLRAAAAAQTEDAAAIAEQRRIDDELQAQAEARTRAQAEADARAEAQARAAAEARARAQAEAEARAAAARNQRYAPPEAENEPEVASTVPQGRSSGTVAATATVKDGIRLNRTNIIGTIGAGKASRALVRLSNGRIITLRLGDKINGGQIVDIGDSVITYVEAGRTKQISVLNGQ